MQHLQQQVTINASLKMYARWPDDKFDNIRRLLREALTAEQYSRLINMRFLHTSLTHRPEPKGSGLFLCLDFRMYFTTQSMPVL